MLKVNDLKVSYGVIPVVRGVSFVVKQNEVIALLGGNGSGKTTILNTISGICRPTEGSINFLGNNIQKTKPNKIVELGIVQIPEGRKIFPYMSVEENLLMGACTPKAWSKRNASLDKAFSMFPILKDRRRQRASLLSGGEQQMMVIARALMALPKLLLVDEPSLGLSPVLVDQIYETLVKIPEDGITVLLSEQNAQYALEISSRGYVLQDGEIVTEGESQALLNSDLVKKAYLGG